MEDMKSIIAQNIIRLRKNANMTQAELAEKLSYTDKAVSKWEKGLKLGYSHIVNSCKGKGTHNITALNASGLYLAGILFDNKDWRDTAQNFMHRVCAKQTADGFWSEHYGPVVIYNTYYLEALGLYYSYSKDPVVLEALKRGAKFHSNLLWQDSTTVSIIDERNA